MPIAHHEHGVNENGLRKLSNRAGDVRARVGRRGVAGVRKAAAPEPPFPGHEVLRLGGRLRHRPAQACRAMRVMRALKESDACDSRTRGGWFASAASRAGQSGPTHVPAICLWREYLTHPEGGVACACPLRRCHGFHVNQTAAPLFLAGRRLPAERSLHAASSVSSACGAPQPSRRVPAVFACSAVSSARPRERRPASPRCCSSRVRGRLILQRRGRAFGRHGPGRRRGFRQVVAGKLRRWAAKAMESNAVMDVAGSKADAGIT